MTSDLPENKQPISLRGSWPFVLMGCVFLFFAVVVPAMVVSRLAQLNDDQALYQTVGALTVSLSFGPVGCMLLAAVIYFLRDNRITEQLVATFPAQPWKHRLDWSTGVSGHWLLGRTVVYIGLAVTANAIVIGVISLNFLSPPDQVNNGPQVNPLYLGMIFSVFLLASIGLLLYALWIARDAYRFRNVWCELCGASFIPGGIVRAVIRWPSAGLPTVPLRVTLSCTANRWVRAKLWGANAGESEQFQFSFFEAQYAIEPAALAMHGDIVELPIRFALPTAVPTTDQPSEWSVRIHWRSRIGLNHSVEFELPVFKHTLAAEHIAQGEAFDARYLGDEHKIYPKVARRVTLEELVAEVYGSFQQSSPDRWQLRLSRSGQHPLFTWLCGAAFLIAFTAAGLMAGGWLGLFLSCCVDCALQQSR